MFLFQLFVPEVSGTSFGYEVKTRHLVPYALSEEGRRNLDEGTAALLEALRLVKPGNIVKKRSQIESHWHIPSVRDSNVSHWELNGPDVDLVRAAEVRQDQASIVLPPGFLVAEALPILAEVRLYASRMGISLPDGNFMKVRGAKRGVRFSLEK